MSSSLSGKKILFIGPQTFNYEKEILAELDRLGAQAVYRSDKPGNSFFLKVMLRLFPKLLWRYSDRIFGRWLVLNGPTSCDVIFVIKGEGLSPKFIDGLRTRYKNAQFVLYLWDSIKNVRGVEAKFSKFDHHYSFDSNDCKRYQNFKYRPLFFLERYCSTESTAGLGLFFVGTLNGDRPKVISRIIRALPRQINFNYWLFVRNGIELFFRRIFDASLKDIDPSRLLRIPMDSQVVNGNFKSSVAIVDIEHPNQIGLTMRTFEVLASGKKLITTNRNILNHDFYHQSRICIVDRHNPQFDLGFFEAQMVPLPASFYEKYSLKGWLLDILDCAATKEGDLVK